MSLAKEMGSNESKRGRKVEIKRERKRKLQQILKLYYVYVTLQN